MGLSLNVGVDSYSLAPVSLEIVAEALRRRAGGRDARRCEASSAPRDRRR
jgi:hypothetical protein